MLQSTFKLRRLLFVVLFLANGTLQNCEEDTKEDLLFPFYRGDIPLENDNDVFSLPITIPEFPFFGRNFTTLFISTNGLIYFNDVPESFNRSNNVPVIAAFWADLDTTVWGTVLYRSMTRPSAADPLFCQADNIIRRIYGPSMGGFTSSWMLVATWNEVAFHDTEDDGSITNSFQIVLVTNDVQSFAIFNYDEITWTTAEGDIGTGLGEDPAKVFFDLADGIHSYSVQSSETNDVVNIDDVSNIGTKGRWMFRIDKDVIEEPVDTLGPIVTCPNNVTSFVDTGMTDGIVTWSPTPTATDNVEGPIDTATIVCENHVGEVVTSSSRFPIGGTTVTCRANDTVPNKGSCEFHITVKAIDGSLLFPYGQGDTLIENEDDTYSTPITIPVFPFFGQKFTTLFVISNGILSFNEEETSYTPEPFPLESGIPVIAVFWADVDLSHWGTVMYRHMTRVSATDPLFFRADSIISQTYGAAVPGFTASWMLVATWYKVSFYESESEDDVTNTFQVVLVTNHEQSFVIFNYEEITWTTSDGDSTTGLGEGPAKVGFDASDGINFYSTPTSETADVVNIDEESNIGTKGRWLFRIDKNDIGAPPDSSIPVVTCPNTVTSSLGPGMKDAIVTWSPIPSAIDINDGPIDPATIVCENHLGEVVSSTSSFPFGVTTVTCRASNTIPKEGSCGFNITLTDIEGPDVNCNNIAVPVVDASPGIPYATVTWLTIPTAIDAVDGTITTVNCSDHLGNVASSGGRYRVGVTTVTCRARDTSMNEGSCQFTFTVAGLDIVSPDVTCPAVSESHFVDAGSASATIVWSTLPTANDTYDGLIDAATITCQDQLGTVIVSGARFPVGTATVTCSVNDTALNEGSCQFNIKVTDNEAPTVICPSNPPAQTLEPGMSQARVTWTPLPSAFDAVDGLVNPDSIVCVSVSGSILTSGGLYPVGTTVVTCQTTDTAHNQGSCQFNITVLDDISPDVTCAASVPHKTVDVGRQDAVVVWSQSPTANDNVDGVIEPVVCRDMAGIVVTSGGRYPIGTTIVTCRALDASQNVGLCQFYITVLDSQGPVVSCPDSVSTQVTEKGRHDTVVEWSRVPSAVDAVEGSIPLITCRNEHGDLVVVSGDRFEVGTTIVTCLASDSVQNEGSCHFSITVLVSDTADSSAATMRTLAIASSAAVAVLMVILFAIGVALVAQRHSSGKKPISDHGHQNYRVNADNPDEFASPDMITGM